uniref:5'-3' exonuclease domain-containing protein n=1 Tax=viral metagenome TaxID=1070528 RepID=A0A6C0EE51_9ZZZZ
MNNYPIILIDASYTSFYRFYATIRWYSLAHNEEFKIFCLDPKYDWFDNKIFIEKYEKMYLNSIIKIIKKNIFNNSYIFFCMDSPLEKLWRSEIFTDYKGERKYIIQKYNFNNVFKYTYNNIIPNIINNHKNIYSLRINYVEADDIIGAICLYLKNTDQKIYIISGDNDFCQLGRKNIYFLNYKSKKLIVLTEEEAIDSLNKKIIFGDKSDSIKGIYEKGYKIKKNDLLKPNILDNYLSINFKAKKQYELNKLMIDFNYIPKKHYNNIIKYFTKYYN